MNLSSLKARLLQARIALPRIGMGNILAAAILLAAAVGWLYSILIAGQYLDSLQARVTIVREKLARQESAPPDTIEKTLPEKNLDRFYSTLGEARSSDIQIKRIFQIARESGLSLKEAEYKLAHDKSGLFYAYQMTLPVTGKYSDISKFCRETLASIPFASLSEILLSRNSVGAGLVEARLRFTFYLAEASAPDRNVQTTQRTDAP